MEPLVTIEQLMWKHFPEQVWLADKLIPAGAITILSGAPASCKTWVTLHIALSVANGEAVFESFATSQGSVLIIDEENGERLLQERLFKLQAMADLPIYFSSQPGFVLNEDSMDAALLSCKTHDIKLVIIDSLVRVHASDENSAGDMSGVFKHLKRFTAEGITVLVTHHNRKPGANNNNISNEMRGSSDILASVDCHIAIKRKGNNLTLYQAKNRYAEELEPFEVRVATDNETFKLKYQGELEAQEDRSQIIKNAVLKLLGEHHRLFQKELLAGLDKFGVKTNEHKLRELLKEMVVDGAVTETAGLGKTKYYGLNAEANHE